MDTRRTPLELLPMEQPPAREAELPLAGAVASAPPEVIDVMSPDDARRQEAMAAHAADPPAGDRFDREAAKQYAQGHLDTALWKRAVALADGDERAAVPAYLRARATALRVADRQRRAAPRSSGPVRPPPAVPHDDVLVDEAPEDGALPSPRNFAHRRLVGRYRSLIIGGAVAVPLLAVAAYLLVGRTPDAPAPAARTAVAAPKAPPAAPKAEPEKDKAQANADFLAKLAQFRDTGNWNMFVLYAVEWTRREPKNPEAWAELRAGYANLRQFEDELGAAKKAVEYAPANAVMWRHLGNAHLDVDDPNGALAAFNEAVARDAQDAYSWQQVALLHARQGRVAEARTAFDAALALQPGDALTNCLANGVAHLQVGKDLYAVNAQVRALDARCRGGDAVAAPEAPPQVSPSPKPADPRSARRSASAPRG